MSRRFDQGFREEAALSDGTVAVLRLLRPEDAGLLSEGFRRLSPDSRYRRFFAVRNELSADEVHYLCEPDGERHFALAATTLDGSGGLGVARFIKLQGEEEVAEFAVTVLDEMQGKGLGRLLLLRLAAAARERDVERFRCLVLADNEPMKKLLETIGSGLKTRIESGVLEIEVPLSGVEGTEPPAEDHPLYRLLILLAAGGILVGNATSELRARLKR